MNNKIGILVSVWLAIFVNASFAANASYTDQICAQHVFANRLEWVGTAPSEEDSRALLSALNSFDAGTIKTGLASLEAFLTEHPDSPWTPVVRVNLAEYYRTQGRYTLALNHWEKAWGAVKNSSEENGQRLAARIIAGWTRLLASIGEKEKMKALFAEMKQLELPMGFYSTQIGGSRDGLIMMNAVPGVSYRCGSYALGNMAKSLGLGTNIWESFFKLDSPDGGFHVSDLLVIAATNGMPVQAVHRPIGDQIVVPSIVHWKLNHFGAIVAQKDGRYKVVDPTFRGHVWMEKETIDSEASGTFLVPQGKAPTQWAKLTASECAVTYGKGYPNHMLDEEDSGTCDCPPCDDDSDDDSEDPPSANDGPGDGTPTPDCPPDGGMPRWSVSEPYTTLWLKDTPLFYRQSNGKWMTLQLRYKHRGEYKGDNIGGFGPYWECNWLAFVHHDSSSGTIQNHRGGGGIHPLSIDFTPDYLMGRRAGFSAPVGGGTRFVPIIKTPTGAMNHYDLFTGSILGGTNYFLTHRMNRYGRSTLFNYQSIGSFTRLTSVADKDGRTCSLDYDAIRTNLITSVSDPYGHTAYFNYDSQGRLTNITDVAGMSTRFTYSGDIVTSMVTPYGTNIFQIFEGTSGTNYATTLRRSLLITEPSGEKQLYAYCDNGPAAVAGDGLVNYRMSYHWNRAQYSSISSTGITSVLDMPDADYLLGTSKHWMHGNTDTDGYVVSDTLNTIGKPANAAGIRTAVHFGYMGGSASSSFIGTMKKIRQIVTPSGTGVDIIDRNTNGRPTTLIYYNAGYAATYSNIFDPTGENLQTVWGPRGERVRAYGYHPVITNLLVAVTNALNEVTRYTYDTNSLRVTSITFPNGLVRSNIYASSGFLSQQMDIGVRTNYFGYQNGNLVAKTNELGLVTTYIYDNLNRLISTAFPDTTTISNIYDKLDLVATKDRLNQWSYFGYNNVRQLMAATNVAGQVTTYDYCSCGSPSQVTRWNGSTPITTLYAYDMAGNLTNVFYPDGYQLDYTYNSSANDQVKTISDRGGHQLHLYYAVMGSKFKVSSATLNGAILFTNMFDEYGRTIGTVDRNGVTVTNDFDYSNRLVARRSIGLYGEMTGLETFEYDSSGLTNYTDALGKVTRYARDLAGRVRYETNANAEVLGFTYSPADQLLTLTDGKNQTTRWNYDTFGRVTNKVDAANNVLFVYQYDPLDRLTNRWSAAKGNTGYKYDPVGNLTNVVYASGYTTNIVLVYDGLNRLTNMIDGVGATTFGWTLGDQLASEDGPWASDTVGYTYTNRLRNALSLTQPSISDWVQNYGYDEVMRLTNVLSAAGNFRYEYGINSSYGAEFSDKIQRIYLPSLGGNALLIENNYDGLSRLTDTTLRTNVFPTTTILNQHTYSYNDGNQRTQQVFTAGLNGQYNYVNYTYDNIGQLKTAKGYDHNYDPATYTYSEVARVHEQFGYAYDAAWNLQCRTNNALVETFNTDSRNQLTTATRAGTLTVTGTASEPRGDATYGPVGVTNVTVSGTGLSSGSAELYFDGSWARAGASLTDGNNSYTATAQDTYGRSSTDSVTVNLPTTSSFVYDLNGNLRTNNTRIFDYDDENQLIRITEPSAWKSEFTYDGMMRRRIRKEYTWSGGTWVKTNEMRYVYDGRLVVQERDGNNLPLVTYTRGNDLSGSLEGAGGIGGLLARTDNSALVTPHSYYHCDGNGNVTSLVNTNGAIMARYNYDPYGNILSMSGPLAEANTYRFSSKEFHANSGLSYYLYRYYSPNLQRWMNRDPIEEWDNLNLYAYTHNRPSIAIDSFGWCENDPPGSVSGHLNAETPVPEINPFLPDANQKPPGWKPSWPKGFDNRGSYVQNPDSKIKYYPHPEDDRHWPHYDDDQNGRYPDKCEKPRPGQKKPPYGKQSSQNPWPQPPTPPTPPQEPQTTPVIISPITPIPTPPLPVMESIPVTDPILFELVFP